MSINASRHHPNGFEDHDQIRVESAEIPRPGWDYLVNREPAGTYCHFGNWASVMTDVLGHECLFLHAWREPKGGPAVLDGLLPLVRVRSLFFGHYLVSMPFLNYGGAIGGEESRQRLLSQAVDEAESSGADLLEIRARSTEGNGADPAELCSRLTRNQRKVSVRLKLATDAEEFWKEGLRSKVRSQVRRPMKEGLETRFGNTQIDEFYEVFSRNMRDLGTPVLPKSLFQALPGAFGDSVAFGVVYDGRVPVAAGCAFRKGPEVEMTWASSLREYSRSAPNMLLYWRFLEWAIENGATVFNFGRCTPGSGSHRFKLQWGGEDEPLPWATWAKGDKAQTPNPGQGRYSAAIRTWQRLPLGVTRSLGPFFARRIP